MDPDVGVDVLDSNELGVPGYGVVKTLQFLVETLLLIVLHWVIDRRQEDLDAPYAFLVVLVQSLFG